MQGIDLQLEPNEASDLCPFGDEDLLAPLGWDAAFATVLDEAPAERALAIVGHESGAPGESGWSAKRVKAKPTRAKGKTDDAEACTRGGGRLLLLGSQFGTSDGPLDPKRSWIARVEEAAVATALADGSKPRLEIRRLRFALHRAINDALEQADIELAEVGQRTRSAYVDATIAIGSRKDKRWAGAVRWRDHPVNVEAAEFRADGRLLLGLRYPVTSGGEPILVELENVDAIFEGDDPAASAAWVLEGAGDEDEPRGVRALHHRGQDEFEVILGNLESGDKDSPLLADWPEAERARSEHLRFALPLVARGGPVRTEVRRRFDDTQRVEGVALADEAALYVIDRDGKVALRLLALEPHPGAIARRRRITA